MFWPRMGRFGWDFDPWQDLRRIRREVNDMLEGFQRRTGVEFPAVNIWSKGDELIATAEVPGIDPKDLDVTVRGDMLTLRGTRKPVELKEGETYHRQERGYGDFVRTVQLPYEVEPDKVSAAYRKGVLTLTLPRAEADKPKRIAVKTSA